MGEIPNPAQIAARMKPPPAPKPIDIERRPRIRSHVDEETLAAMVKLARARKRRKGRNR